MRVSVDRKHPSAWAIVAIALMASLSLFVAQASATSLVRAYDGQIQLRNDFNGEYLAHAPGNQITTTPDASSFSTVWIIEYSEDRFGQRIRAAETGAFLYFDPQTGALALGPIQADWDHALWEVLRGQVINIAVSMAGYEMPLGTVGNGQVGLLSGVDTAETYQYASWRITSFPPEPDTTQQPSSNGTASGAPAPQSAGPQVQVSLRNGTNEPLQLAWLGSNGQMQILGTLPPGSATPMTAQTGWAFKALRSDGSALTQNPVDYTVSGTPNEEHVFTLAATPSAPAPAVDLVTIVFQNVSDRPVDIFYDNPQGDQEFLMSLASGMELVQQSPVGAIWRLADQDTWLDAVRATEASEQLVRFPVGQSQ